MTDEQRAPTDFAVEDFEARFQTDDVPTEGVGLSSEIAAGWEAAGRKIAPMLGSYSTAVITSSDELAAAHVALGIGFAEAERRRVAIGDLVGEVEPLQSLVTSDDPHGISDSFTYGVSLNRIAQPIDASGNLFIMPSGTGSVRDASMLANTRWHRLANGFHEVGALLILVAPSDAPGLRDLIAQMDGVVLVGESGIDSSYLHVLARVPTPLDVAPKRPSARKSKLSLGRLLLAAGLLIVLVGIGYAMRFGDLSQLGRRLGLNRGDAAAASSGPLAQRAAAETLVVAAPESMPEASAMADYSVELAAYNTHESALMRLRQLQSELPAATIAPVPIGSARETYYKVIAGAYRKQSDAEGLLQRLRGSKVVSSSEGTVVRTPYALLLDSTEEGRTHTLVEKYAGAPHPMYVLVQPDGSLKLYAGAFERPEDSAALLLALRAAQLNPVLVYRTGRIP